jgi:hypothetical protein
MLRLDPAIQDESPPRKIYGKCALLHLIMDGRVNPEHDNQSLEV